MAVEPGQSPHSLFTLALKWEARHPLMIVAIFVEMHVFMIMIMLMVIVMTVIVDF